MAAILAFFGANKIAGYLGGFAVVAAILFGSYYIGVRHERADWEVKQAVADQKATEERIKANAEFERKLAEFDKQQAIETASLEARVKEYDTFVQSLGNRTSCLGSSASQRVRDLLRGID